MMGAALLAPMMAAGGGAAAAGTGLTQLATLASAGSAIFGGISGMQEAKSAKRAAEINSYIGRTRAMQTDVAAREGLASELATMRATFAVNGQRPSVGTQALSGNLREVRGRERRIGVGNEMQTAADFRTKANNINPMMSLAGGIAKAGPSLFDLYELRTRG